MTLWYLILALLSVPAHAQEICRPACMNYVINVHDIVHVSESADTLIRLADLFSRHKVKGEFYITGPMVELYQRSRPDVIAKLKNTGMTVSYAIRAPHPLVPGFDRRLRGLDDAQLEATIRDYETYGLDLSTGELRRDRAGGYTLLKQAFGRAPVTVVSPSTDPRIARAALKVHASMGAQAVVSYHEEGASIDNPLTWRAGLVSRPSDIGVTHWGPYDAFWWNMLPKDASYDPLARLRKRLDAWSAWRGPFVTSLIHENNFPRDGAESWTLAYYTDKSKRTALPPPWDLSPPEQNRVRSAADQATIWSAYEAMVAWSAANMQVVTGTEIVQMAR